MLLTLFLLSTIIFTTFAWAIRRHFVSEGPNPRMRALAILGLINFVVYVERLLFSPHSYWSPYVVGAALHLTSVYIFLMAVLATRERKLHIAFSEAPSDFIITSGPYAYLRHPFYVSYTIFWIGCAIETLSFACAPLSVLLFGFYVSAARQEEDRFLTSAAATAYREYKAKVGLFWPKVNWEN
jgi:protein-S-isoprenylcysteine O-methyltransferase Ste14